MSNFITILNEIKVASSNQGVTVTNQFENISGEAFLAKLNKVTEGMKDGSHWIRTILHVDDSGKCKGRSNENAMSSANLLIIDADCSVNTDGVEVDGAPDPWQVSEILRKNDIAHILHGSYSHYVGEKGNRYRIVLVTKSSYEKEQLFPTAEAIVLLINMSLAKLGSSLLAYAKENNAWGQPWYYHRMPVGCTAKPLYFSHMDGQLIDVVSSIILPSVTPVIKKTNQFKDKQISPIHAFNEQHNLIDGLIGYGYKRVLKTTEYERWLSPDSASGKPGVLVREHQFFSFHNDAFNDGQPHDSFDLMRVREGLTERDAIIRAAQHTLAPNGRTVDEHNKSLAKGASFSWPEPSPLIAISLQDPYPVDALPETIRAAVIEVQSFIKAPIPLVAATALSALSLAGQTYVDVKRAEKLCGPTGLFMITIADSGERKSTCDGFFMASIQEYEKREAEAAVPLIKDYNAQLAIWESIYDGLKKEISVLAGKGNDTESKRKALMELEHQKPLPPKVPRLIDGDVTPEALKRNLATGWPSAGIISSEGGTVFGAHAMGKDSAMRNFSTLNQGWDGKSAPTDRVGSDTLITQEVRLTMGIQVQEATLKEFVSKLGVLARGTGYFARVLFSWPESTQGSRLFTDPPEDWPCLDKFHKRITTILNQPAPIHANGTLMPCLMPLTKEAKTAWIKFHDSIETELHNAGALYDVRDVASKAADNAARLAALFHLLEHGTDGSVGVDSFDSASLIVLWHLKESQRFFSELALPPELVAAAKLDSWLISYCLKHSVGQVSSRIVQQCGPNSLRKKDVMEAALSELKELNRVRIKIDGQRKIIMLNPALMGNEI